MLGVETGSIFAIFEFAKTLIIETFEVFVLTALFSVLPAIVLTISSWVSKSTSKLAKASSSETSNLSGLEEYT